MFQRFVSLGNSITSGFRLGGINDSTQRQVYPVILAPAMRGDSFLLRVARYTNIFTGTRLGTGSTGTSCFFRATPTPALHLSRWITLTQRRQRSGFGGRCRPRVQTPSLSLLRLPKKCTELFFGASQGRKRPHSATGCRAGGSSDFDK